MRSLERKTLFCCLYQKFACLAVHICVDLNSRVNVIDFVLCDYAGNNKVVYECYLILRKEKKIKKYNPSALPTETRKLLKKTTKKSFFFQANA